MKGSWLALFDCCGNLKKFSWNLLLEAFHLPHGKQLTLGSNIFYNRLIAISSKGQSPPCEQRNIHQNRLIGEITHSLSLMQHQWPRKFVQLNHIDPDHAHNCQKPFPSQTGSHIYLSILRKLLHIQTNLYWYKKVF